MIDGKVADGGELSYKSHMQNAVLTLRIPEALKQRIKASAKKSGQSGHRWSVEVLARAAHGEEPDANWSEHFKWLRKHGRKGSGLGDEVIRARR